MKSKFTYFFTLFFFSVAFYIFVFSKLLASTTKRGNDGVIPSQPENVNVIHNSGQSFITWTERSEINGESYKIYRHTQPINVTNILSAQFVYQVWEGSNIFYGSYYRSYTSVPWKARYTERFTITNNGEQLSVGTGLLVWTLANEDFNGGTSGTYYYAVTTVDSLGVENLIDFTNNTFGSINESIADPLPVRVNYDVGSNGHLYIQYMDLRNWNPTFHAPNEDNGYYNKDKNLMSVKKALAYAYDYVVYEPEVYPEGLVPAYTWLHGWDGNFYTPYTSAPSYSLGWKSYKIFPIDQSETWYFGFAKNKDYRVNINNPVNDTIVNFTEQRILRMFYDLIRNPPGQNVDTNRLYIYGGSMGGSGSLAFALRYPNVFASCYSIVSMTNWKTDGDGGGADWREDVYFKWGDIVNNLPILIKGPDHYVQHLQKYNGYKVWDWQNHQGNIVSRISEDIVPFGIAHGIYDSTIEWSTQGQPAYIPFNNSKQIWGGETLLADHSGVGFFHGPPNLNEDPSAGPFYGFQIKKNETGPGISNFSLNSVLPPSSSAEGQYNISIDWSTSWRNWDITPIDSLNVWQMSFKTTTGQSATIDVTPRRRQNFRTFNYDLFKWSNIRKSDMNIIQLDTVVADTNNLVTIEGFNVEGICNRLRIENIGKRVTKTPIQGNESTTYFDSTNIIFIGNVNSTSPVTVSYYHSISSLGQLPLGINYTTNYFWRIESNGINFTQGRISIPIDKLTGINNFENIVWLKRNIGSDIWNNIGGNIINGKLESNIFDEFGEFIIGSSSPLVSVYNTEDENIPSSFNLYQNYPNPFNPSTKISFDLPINTFVNLEIFDVLGRKVHTLVNDNLLAGKYEVIFDSYKLRLTSGIYFYILHSNDNIFIRKMLLVK